MKNAKRQHVLRGEYLRRLWIEATKQGKDAELIVVFEDSDIELVCQVRKRT